VPGPSLQSLRTGRTRTTVAVAGGMGQAELRGMTSAG
jgi:hypothetical protein